MSNQLNNPNLHASSYPPTNGDTCLHQRAMPLFPYSPGDFAAELFRNGVKAEVESLLWSTANVLQRHAGVRCEWGPFVYDSLEANDPKERWGHATIDIAGANGKSAMLHLEVIEVNGARTYTFELGEIVLFSAVFLKENVAEIFPVLAAGIWKLLS